MADDAAHAGARIRGLETQVEISKDPRDSLWTEREKFRKGGLKAKKDLKKFQTNYNRLEDERDELSEKGEDLEDRLVDMITARDNLQTRTAELKTEQDASRELEASLREEIATFREQLRAHSPSPPSPPKRPFLRSFRKMLKTTP